MQPWLMLHPELSQLPCPRVRLRQKKGQDLLPILVNRNTYLLSSLLERAVSDRFSPFSVRTVMEGRLTFHLHDRHVNFGVDSKSMLGHLEFLFLLFEDPIVIPTARM